MGGGDLNTKKSWHPNTMKNQERVWKAEQAAAQEKQKILELQRERAHEQDRAELNDMIKRNAGTTNDNRLHWMYDKPDKKVQHEDYLLGKAIDSNYDKNEKSESDAIPAVSRRVVGASMLGTGDDTQVDLARKLREDPLLLVKERERAARAALLNNPLHRKRITEMLRNEQEARKESKSTKKDKKKDLDAVLAEKLNALGAAKGVNLATLLDSDSSSDSSDSDKIKKKKKKKTKKRKKSKEKKKSRQSLETEDSEKEKNTVSSYKTMQKNTSKHKNQSDYSSDHDKRKKRNSPDAGRNDYERNLYSAANDNLNVRKYSSKRNVEETFSKHNLPSKYRRRSASRDRNTRHYSPESSSRDRKQNFVPTDRLRQRSESRERGRTPELKGNKGTFKEKSKSKGQSGLSEAERAAKLAEMAAAGAEREVERGRRVAHQRASDAAVERLQIGRAPVRSEARVLPDSLESRIHSNRHYIQRDQRHMNENFARR